MCRSSCRPKKFEDAVVEYKQSEKIFKNSDLDKIYMLRKGPQFTFKNQKPVLSAHKCLSREPIWNVRFFIKTNM
ncbi:MAG: hypothetical protein CM1200mP28_09410 [Deltaproteobacteria bacterium]|nr:MAG: hypothetical protein CM1200mP28_09410 [Deltaproteobacteria bacterium]